MPVPQFRPVSVENAPAPSPVSHAFPPRLGFSRTKGMRAGRFRARCPAMTATSPTAPAELRDPGPSRLARRLAHQPRLLAVYAGVLKGSEAEANARIEAVLGI